MNTETDLIIIHRGTDHATIRGQYASSLDAWELVYGLLKQGRAALLLDSESTLMYRILDQSIVLHK